MTRDWVLHVDLDQFIAAVEVLRRPELVGRPVVVGGSGDPTRARQVVATASYEARAYGVGSGMPLRLAARKCPDAAFLPTDSPAYEAASAAVMATLRTFPVVVEVWGWDEAFIGAQADDPEGLAADLRGAVQDVTGLSCSIGIGQTKLQAKTATGFAKPAGIARLTFEDWMTVMGERPTQALWGIGRRTADRLADLRIRTVRQLSAAETAELAAAFGPTIGPHLKQLGRGGARSPVVDEPRQARSRSREETFAVDLTDRAAIDDRVETMAEALAREVVADGRSITHVAVKVRVATFFTRIKTRKLPEPTTDPHAVARMAGFVLDLFTIDRPVRLLGVRVDLAPVAPRAPTVG